MGTNYFADMAFYNYETLTESFEKESVAFWPKQCGTVPSRRKRLSASDSTAKDNVGRQNRGCPFKRIVNKFSDNKKGNKD